MAIAATHLWTAEVRLLADISSDVYRLERLSPSPKTRSALGNVKKKLPIGKLEPSSYLGIPADLSCIDERLLDFPTPTRKTSPCPGSEGASPAAHLDRMILQLFRTMERPLSLSRKGSLSGGSPYSGKAELPPTMLVMLRMRAISRYNQLRGAEKIRLTLFPHSSY